MVFWELVGEMAQEPKFKLFQEFEKMGLTQQGFCTKMVRRANTIGGRLYRCELTLPNGWVRQTRTDPTRFSLHADVQLA